MNQVFLVGRLTRDPVLKKQNGKMSCYITIAVKRQYKNSNGIYETDFISCTVWNVIAERVNEYCRKGDIISVKARVQNNNYTDKDENKVYSYEFIADQVSFMANKGQYGESEMTDNKASEEISDNDENVVGSEESDEAEDGE